jgi:hypothetical protein
MRRKPINPYHIIPFYSNDTEASLQGHFYSPTLRLPPLQFYLDEALGVAGWKLVRQSDGAEYAQQAGDWTESTQADPAISFYTYPGTDLDTPVPPGLYRAVVELGSGGLIYSHLLCCTALFDGPEGQGSSLELSVAACSQDFDYSFEMNLDPSTAYEVYQDGGLALAGTGPFTITGAPVAVGNERTHVIVIGGGGEDSNGGRAGGSREYTLVVSDITDACNFYTLNEGDTQTGIGEENGYLEWWEDNDDGPLRILYHEQAGGAVYRPRFYGKFWAAAPSPFIEEEVLVTKGGVPRLRSMTVAQVWALECWPVPDIAFAPLQVAGRARNIRAYNMEGAETVVDYMEFSAVAVGEDDRLKGVFNLRYNSAVRTACATDYDIA